MGLGVSSLGLGLQVPEFADQSFGFRGLGLKYP